MIKTLPGKSNTRENLKVSKDCTKSIAVIIKIKQVTEGSGIWLLISLKTGVFKVCCLSKSPGELTVDDRSPELFHREGLGLCIFTSFSSNGLLTGLIRVIWEVLKNKNNTPPDFTSGHSVRMSV